MNEKRLIERVRAALDEGTRGLDRQVLQRLAAARAAAVTRQRSAEPALALAGRHGALPGGAFGPRRWAAVAALLLAATVTVYWQSREQPVDPADVDAALLASDLPLKAYTDPRFPAWLQRAEQ